MTLITDPPIELPATPAVSTDLDPGRSACVLVAAERSRCAICLAALRRGLTPLVALGALFSRAAGGRAPGQPGARIAISSRFALADLTIACGWRAGRWAPHGSAGSQLGIAAARSGGRLASHGLSLAGLVAPGWTPPQPLHRARWAIDASCGPPQALQADRISGRPGGLPPADALLLGTVGGDWVSVAHCRRPKLGGVLVVGRPRSSKGLLATSNCSAPGNTAAWWSPTSG
jgi:hypothetical protein